MYREMMLEIFNAMNVLLQTRQSMFFLLARIINASVIRYHQLYKGFKSTVCIIFAVPGTDPAIEYETLSSQLC